MLNNRLILINFCFYFIEFNLMIIFLTYQRITFIIIIVVLMVIINIIIIIAVYNILFIEG